MKQVKIDSTDTNVSKFVFEKENDIAVEAVLYRYGAYRSRTVICCSVQCGCPIGCSFCGTGSFFKRNLTTDETTEQVETCLSFIDCKTLKLSCWCLSYGEIKK